MRRALTALGVIASHWRRNPVQFFSVFAGLALATALWTGVQAINAEARASYARSAALLGGSGVAALVPTDGLRAPDRHFAALRRAGYLVSPVVEDRISIAGVRIRVLGIEPLSLPSGSRPAALFDAGGETESNAPAFLTPPWEGLAAPETVRALEAATGLPPLREDPTLPPGLLVVDIGVAQALLGWEGEVARFLLAGDAPPGHTLSALGLRLASGDEEAAVEGLADSFHLNLAAFSLLAFAVGLVIAHAAIGLATEQRLSTFRTLRATGLSATGLAGVLAAEIAIFALIAGIAGAALGYVIAAALLPDVAASIGGLYGLSVSGGLTLSPSWWLGGLAMAFVGAAIAGARALWTVWRLPPLASARPEAWRREQARQFRASGGAAAACVLAGATLYAFAEGLTAGFTVMALGLLAAAFALPPALALATSLGARLARGAAAEWIWADMRQQTSALSLALVALMLALSANIGVGAMVGGFRIAFLDWLDDRLAAEVYVRAEDEAQAQEIAEWAVLRADIRAALPQHRARVVAEGDPIEAIGVIDHATYRDTWPLMTSAPGGWDAVFAGEAVMISEQFARRRDLGPGDPVDIGRGVWRVGGIYPDYGNPRGQLLMATPDLLSRFPEAERMGIGLRTAPDQAQAVIAALTERFALPASNIVDQAQLKAGARAVFERTFAVTAALNVLTLAVAGVALFTSLLSLADRRLPQLAPLWAIGLTRRRLAWIELQKTVGLALLTAMLAIPVGLALAWLLVAVVNVEAFGWRLPFYLFPADWMRLAALAALIAALSAITPIWRLARISPARLLRIFADAR